jgi:Zn-dependent protease
MFGPGFIEHAIVYGPVILLSLTVHEYFHAWTALRFGDDTAARQGRLTLNPLAHLDLFGTIVMVMSQFRFGWAKPVPVNPMKLRNPRVANIWVSAAGPLANFGMALIWAMIFRVTFDMSDGLARYAMAGVEINVVLGVFNLIPLFPLDGSHIVRNLLPRDLGLAFDRFSRYAPYLLMLLVFTRAIWIVLGAPVRLVINLLLGSH